MIENGDIVTIDIEKRALDVNLSVNQFEERRAKWTAPPYKSPRGVLYKVFSIFFCISLFPKLIIPMILDMNGTDNTDF